MKKSEMVQLMYIAYAETFRGGNSEMSELERIEFVLNSMEEAGILPPSYINPKYNKEDADKYNAHPFLEYPIPYTLKNWEPENE